MERYLTPGISRSLDLAEQLILWNLYDTMKVETKDYLQVFTLKKVFPKRGVPLQKVVHSQEVPPYTKESTFGFANPIDTKIFIINDITHETMLLASEY